MRTARAAHALIAFGFASAHVTVIGVNVHGVSLLLVRIALVVRVSFADARVGRGRGHEGMMRESVQTVWVMMGMIDATSSEVRIWQTYGRTARMIPPMPAHIGIDIEFAPTARKWTTIRYRKTLSAMEAREERAEKGIVRGW